MKPIMQMFIGASIAALAIAGPIHAESKPNDTETLGMIYVGEAGWSYERDHRAISHVFSNRSAMTGTPFIRMARRYSYGTFHNTRPRAQWIRGLREDCSTPKHWPYRESRWLGFYREKCLEVMARARTFLANPSEVADPCDGRALHFGFEGDGSRGRMRLIDCGDTKNLYYSLGRKR